MLRNVGFTSGRQNKSYPFFFLNNPANPANYSKRKQSMGLFLALYFIYYNVLKAIFYYTEFISIIGCEIFKFIENYTGN